jgi:hypothetical protein
MASEHGDSARRDVREYESLGLLLKEHSNGTRGDSPLGSSKCFLERAGRILSFTRLYRAATPLLSEVLGEYTRPFPSQVGQEPNVGTFK